MPSAPHARLGSPIAVEAELQLPEAVRNTAPDGSQSGPGRPSPASTPRPHAGWPPSSSPDAENESPPSTDVPEPRPPSEREGLRPSQLGSYDRSRSPMVRVSIHAPPTGAGFSRVGAVSPAESARSAGKENKLELLSPAEASDGAGNEPRLEVAKLPRRSCVSPPSALSSPVDKLLRFPRGRPLRFFIDAEEVAGSETKR